MNKLLLLLLLGFAMVVLLVPFSSYRGDLEKVSLYVSGDKVLLKGDSGQLVLSRPSNQFLVNLIDPSNIQRIELVPYGGGVGCNVLDGSGKRFSGPVDECLAVALQLNKLVYVDKSLLHKPEVEMSSTLGL